MKAFINKYKYLLFDLDNTLFDFEKAEEVSLRRTFEKFGIPHTRENIQAYFEVNRGIWQEFEEGKISQDRLRWERFRRFSLKTGVSFDPVEAGDFYLEDLSHCAELIEGAEELIKSLSGRFELIMITNGLTVVQRPKIKRSSIGKYFSHLYISQEVGTAKPNPEFFDAVFSGVKIENKEEALIIGDSLSSDIAGGCNYGIDTCWFNPGRKKPEGGCFPTYEIHRLKELNSPAD
jgi:putative hydrolase of the HAD superfamily